MRWLTMLRMRARAIVRADAVDRDLDVEMREHFEHLVTDYLACGMTTAEARRSAMREFGPMTQLAEQSRDARGVAAIAIAIQDCKYGARLMCRAPVLSVA